MDECKACKGAHRAHTCGKAGGRRQRVDVNIFDGLDDFEAPAPLRRRADVTMLQPEASHDVMLDESSLVVRAGGSSLGVLTVTPTGRGSSSAEFSRAEWARSREVQRTHFLCLQCSAVRPREEAVCSSCSMPRTTGADSEAYKALQARREANLSSSQAASNLSYLRQRQQDDASLSAGMGE